MEKLFLLDAYALIFRAYYALIRSPRYNSKGMNTSAVFGFVNTLEEVLKKESPTHIGVAFDPTGGTFRHEMYPAYKAQREETPEDIRKAVPYIKEIISAYRIPILEVAGYEADDVIGTLAGKADEKGIFCYMMTPDKDYAQLVTERVNIYRPRTGDKPDEVLTPAKVCERWGLSYPAQMIDLLGLMGDSSDNIPGCPGVGEKTAQKLIAQFGSVEGLLARTDELKGALQEKVRANAEQIRLSRYLATIRRDVPIELDLDALKREEPDGERLREVYGELEFRSLLKGMTEKMTDETEKDKRSPVHSVHSVHRQAAGGMLSLFGTEGLDGVDKREGRTDGGEGHKRDGEGDGHKAGGSAEMTVEAEKIAGTGTGDVFFSNLSGLEGWKHNYQLADTEEKRTAILQFFGNADIFAFDTETDSVSAIDAHLVGMSFCRREGEAWYVPVPADEREAQAVVDEMAPLLRDRRSVKVGQNIKYDLMVMSRYGVELGGTLVDTMVAHYVLQPELHHGMDYMAETLLGYRTIRIEELIGAKGKGQRSMRDLSPALVCDYACEDADVTLRLWHVLEGELHRQGVWELFSEVEMPLVRVLAAMELWGVRVDTAALAETRRHFTDRMVQLEDEIHQLAGTDFNIASPRQVGEVLFGQLKIKDKPKRTKTGQYVTSEEELESLRSRHPIVGKILDHRGLKKLIGTYVEPLPALINPRTGHIHTSFNQAVTATGRLSSSNPNLQNIPVRDDDGREIRRAFIPDEGCLFFSADYSQIELRLMAHLSGDAGLIEAFREGADIHAATAARVFHKPIEEVTRDERSRAKTANFGIIYGISAFGLAERMGVSRTEARELIDSYFATYPDVQRYMDESIRRAREQGYVETLFHRRRYLPDINSHNANVRGYAERNAINAPIQGSAADIIKVAMNRVWQRFKDEGLRSKMILQVHDELNFSVLPDERERVEQVVREAMEGAVSLRVPLIADCGWGSNWLEAH